MNINDNTEMKGKLKISVFESAKLIKEINTNNFISTEGKSYIANQLSGVSLEDPISYMAIGSSSGQTVSDSTLATETARVVLDSRTQGTGGSTNTVVYTASFAAGVGTGTVSEAGLFNASTGGTMLCYSDTFDSINKLATFKIDVQWTITIN